MAEVKAEAPAAAAASFKAHVEGAMRVAAPDTAEGGGTRADRSRADGSSADASSAGVMRVGDDRNDRNNKSERNDSDPLPMLSPTALDAVLLQASK